MGADVPPSETYLHHSRASLLLKLPDLSCSKLAQIAQALFHTRPQSRFSVKRKTRQYTQARSHGGSNEDAKGRCQQRGITYSHLE